MTHYGSGWEELVGKLDSYKNIECYCTNISYKHPEDLYYLISQPHKTNNSFSIWSDVIFHNKDFVHDLCQYFQFIYWCKEFNPTHPELIEYGSRAFDYYRYRLDGMKRYYHYTSQGIWNPSLEGDFLFRSISG